MQTRPSGPHHLGTLPFQDYGKPAVHAVLQGEVRHNTPVLSPGGGQHVAQHKDAAQSPAGEVTGEGITTAVGHCAALRPARRAPAQSVSSRSCAKVLPAMLPWTHSCP
jgi:hypothetical protein